MLKTNKTLLEILVSREQDIYKASMEQAVFGSGGVLIREPFLATEIPKMIGRTYIFTKECTNRSNNALRILNGLDYKLRKTLSSKRCPTLTSSVLVNIGDKYDAMVTLMLIPSHESSTLDKYYLDVDVLGKMDFENELGQTMYVLCDAFRRFLLERNVDVDNKQYKLLPVTIQAYPLYIAHNTLDGFHNRDLKYFKVMDTVNFENIYEWSKNGCIDGGKDEAE